MAYSREKKYQPFLVLDFSLDVINCIRGLDLKGDGLACQRLDKDLHPSTETENEMKSRFLLNVIIRQRTAIFELLPSKD